MDDIFFDKLFSGELDNLVELPKRVVRLFISSTFTDMTLERNTLMEHVYPRLKKYCRERHGLDFQVVDMRWGVRDEATDDHQTSSLCSREIDNCQRMSLGPNFVALVGDKYGFRPLSSKIKSSEYRSLRQALIQLDINTDFLDVWYKEDTNAIPAEYLLQPISSILKNFTNKQEPDLQSIDQTIWSAIQNRLHELLLIGSRELVKQGKMMLDEQLMRYSISVTEREIIEGCLDVKDAKLHCLVYIRSIVDLRHHMDDCLAKLSPIWGQQLTATNTQGASPNGSSPNRRDSQTRRASLKIGDDVISLSTSCALNANERRIERQRKLIGRYIDMKSTRDNMWQLDDEAQAALAQLRDMKLDAKLRSLDHNNSSNTNIHNNHADKITTNNNSDRNNANLTKYRVIWDQSEGISLKCEEHKQYLNELSEHFYTNITRMIRKSSRNEQQAIVKSGLVNEILQHSHYALHVSRGFHGRSRELDKLRAYILGAEPELSSKPMFLYGVGGSGKTSLLAKAATLSKDWILRARIMGSENQVVNMDNSQQARVEMDQKLNPFGPSGRNPETRKVMDSPYQATYNEDASGMTDNKVEITANRNSNCNTNNDDDKRQSKVLVQASSSGFEQSVDCNKRPCIIIRFCCTTPASSSMLDVLSSVCRQLQFQFYQYGPLSGQSQQHQEHHLTSTTTTPSNSMRVHPTNGSNINHINSNDDSSSLINDLDRGHNHDHSIGIGTIKENERNEFSFASQLAYKRIPEDFVQLVFTFRQLLDNCRHPIHEKRLFIIILDSIERLSSPAQSGVEVKYSWLTSIARLPSNVRLIVSCSSEKTLLHDYASFVHLKRHFLQSHFLQMRQLANDNRMQFATGPIGSACSNSSPIGSQLDYNRTHHHIPEEYALISAQHSGNTSCSTTATTKQRRVPFENKHFAHDDRSPATTAHLSSGGIGRLKSIASLRAANRLPWIVHVKPLGVDLATGVVRHWLKDCGRTLSQQQWALVEECFSHCSRPIFVKLAFGEVLNWRSYSMQSDARGLTFGSSLLGNRKNELLAAQVALNPAVARLAARCCCGLGPVRSADLDDFNFPGSDLIKWQILSLEQEWLNYLDYEQRKQQIAINSSQNNNNNNNNASEQPNKQKSYPPNKSQDASGNNNNDDKANSMTSNEIANNQSSVLIKIDTMMSASGGTKSSSQAISSVSNSLCHLSNTIDDAICQLFARIELQHGFILTKHSLSYITVARNGICENELEDILSLDDVVLDDVFQYHLPPVRRIPPLLWTRIRNDLPDYLSERDADGIVINWHHGHFKRVTLARYLSERKQLVYVHSILADYFLGRWADKPKPFRCTRQQIQMAAEQLDSALQQSGRESGQRFSGGGGTIKEGGSGAASKQPRQADNSAGGSFQRPRASLTGSIGRLAGQRSGSIRTGSSFGARNRLRASEMNDSRLQSMQAKADRRVPQQPLYYSMTTASSGSLINADEPAPLEAQASNDNNVNKSQKDVSEQQTPSSASNSTTKRRYNLRKLTELPYHLIRSGRFLDLAQVVFFNYQWLFASLEALGLQALLADFEDAIRGLEDAMQADELRVRSLSGGAVLAPSPLTPPPPTALDAARLVGLGGEDPSELQQLDLLALKQMIDQLRKLESTIKLSCSVLHADSKMLAPQLLGRLIAMVSKEPDNNKWLARLLEQCDKQGSLDCALLPTDRCLQSPDGMQSSSLEGHAFGITSMSMGADQRHLLAVSNRFIMWDTSTGQVSRNVNPMLEGAIMKQLEMAYNNEFGVSYTSNNLILVLDILTQQVIRYEGVASQTKDHPNLAMSESHQKEQLPIEGLTLIDRFGATRFAVWTKHEAFVLKIVNNELQQSVTMRQRISIELEYSIQLNRIAGSWKRIMSMKSVKLLVTTRKQQNMTELSILEVERENSSSSRSSESSIEILTLKASKAYKNKGKEEDPSELGAGWHLESWEPTNFDIRVAALDLRAKQLIFADSRGQLMLSRRRARSWSRPKLLLEHKNNNNSDDDDGLPLAVELDSGKMGDQELESLLLLDDGLEREDLVQFEKHVDDLNEAESHEIQLDPVFEDSSRTKKLDQYAGDSSCQLQEPSTTGVQSVRLYYNSRIEVLQVANGRMRNYVLRLPKDVQNLSIELGRCQVKAVCLGHDFLVAGAGRRLLFFSLSQETLLRSIDEAHNARIVELLPINDNNENLSQSNMSKTDGGGAKCLRNGATSFLVASASMDKTVKIWTLSNLDKLEEPIERLEDRIESLCILRSQQQATMQLAACVCRSGQLGLFNWATHRLVSPRLGHRGHAETNKALSLEASGERILRAKFSPNGQFLCLATSDSRLLLYTFEVSSFSTRSSCKSGTAVRVGGGNLSSGHAASVSELKLKLANKIHLPSWAANGHTAKQYDGCPLSSSRGDLVRKLKFILQDSRLLTILECDKETNDNKTMVGPCPSSDASRMNEEHIATGARHSAHSETKGLANWTGRHSDVRSSRKRSHEQGDVFAKTANDSHGQRPFLLVLCYSLADSRLLYSIKLRVVGGNPQFQLNATIDQYKKQQQQQQQQQQQHGNGSVPPRGQRFHVKQQEQRNKESTKMKELDGANKQKDDMMNPNVEIERTATKIQKEAKQRRQGPNSKNQQQFKSLLPVVTKDNLHLVALEAGVFLSSSLEVNHWDGRQLNVYSTREGLLLRSINLAKLELAPSLELETSTQASSKRQSVDHPASYHELGGGSSLQLIQQHQSTNPLNNKRPQVAQSQATSSTSSLLAVDLSCEPVTKMMALIYKERASVVCLHDEDSGWSHLIDVHTRQLLISTDFWNGQLSKDGHFGLSYRSPAQAHPGARSTLNRRSNKVSSNNIRTGGSLNRLNSSINSAQFAAASSLDATTPIHGHSIGLQLLEMRRMTPLHTLISGRDLVNHQKQQHQMNRLNNSTNSSSSLILRPGSIKDTQIKCGFTKPNDYYVYYYDPRLGSLLLVRVRDSKLMANYRLADSVSQIKCSPDGLALILALSNGSLCSLAIADPGKNETLVRLSQYPTRAAWR